MATWNQKNQGRKVKMADLTACQKLRCTIRQRRHFAWISRERMEEKFWKNHHKTVKATRNRKMSKNITKIKWDTLYIFRLVDGTTQCPKNCTFEHWLDHKNILRPVGGLNVKNLTEAIDMWQLSSSLANSKWNHINQFFLNISKTVRVTKNLKENKNVPNHLLDLVP